MRLQTPGASEVQVTAVRIRQCHAALAGEGDNRPKSGQPSETLTLPFAAEGACPGGRRRHLEPAGRG